jgi:hypothetical protein
MALLSMSDIERRTFLTSLAAAAMTPMAAAQAPAIPIIDTHIHLFDPTRPQGAPYSGPKNAGPPVPALPARYRALAGPLGAVGAIKVEASPWIEDNLWVLQVAQQDPIRRSLSLPNISGATQRIRCSEASVAGISGAATSRLRSKCRRSSTG